LPCFSLCTRKRTKRRVTDGFYQVDTNDRPREIIVPEGDLTESGHLGYL
jgi:hypothetical protein